MAFFNGRPTKAISGGINTVIQQAKPGAGGSHASKGLTNMPHPVAVTLSLNVPNPFRDFT
jgi:hypothetical protein